MMIGTYSNDYLSKVFDTKHGTGSSEYIVKAFRYYSENNCTQNNQSHFRAKGHKSTPEMPIISAFPGFCLLLELHFYICTLTNNMNYQFAFYLVFIILYALSISSIIFMQPKCSHRFLFASKQFIHDHLIFQLHQSFIWWLARSPFENKNYRLRNRKQRINKGFFRDLLQTSQKLCASKHD